MVIPNAANIKFVVGSGKVVKDSKDCKDRYGDRTKLSNTDNNGDTGYVSRGGGRQGKNVSVFAFKYNYFSFTPSHRHISQFAQCFKFKNLGKSKINDTHYLIMMRVNRLRRDAWWNTIDKHLRTTLIVNLKTYLKKHESFKHVANW